MRQAQKHNIQTKMQAPFRTLSRVWAGRFQAMAKNDLSTTAGSVMYGIMGNVTSVPAKYSISVLMHVGNNGVNQAMASWGKLHRSWYNKCDAAASREKDITLQYLGFSTDNGAYYYYNTVPGKDYEQTMVAVKEDADARGIPYKYVLLDSWWYYKGENGGVSEWAARYAMQHNYYNVYFLTVYCAPTDLIFSQMGWSRCSSRLVG
jgi:hypothetical protein